MRLHHAERDMRDGERWRRLRACSIAKIAQVTKGGFRYLAIAPSVPCAQSLVDDDNFAGPDFSWPVTWEIFRAFGCRQGVLRWV